jgi:hypothetical protein
MVVLARQSRARSASFRDFICTPLDVCGAESLVRDGALKTTEYMDGVRSVLFQKSGCRTSATFLHLARHES